MAKRQDRVELKGSARAPFPGGQDVGPADPNQQIEVSVFLRRGSLPGRFPASAELGTLPPRQRKYLSREEFARLHGASPSDLERGARLRRAVCAESRQRGSRQQDGKTQRHSRSFQLRLWRGPAPLRAFVGHVPRPHRYADHPAELELIVEGVFGLDDRPQAKAHFRC